MPGAVSRREKKMRRKAALTHNADRMAVGASTGNSRVENSTGRGESLLNGSILSGNMFPSECLEPPITQNENDDRYSAGNGSAMIGQVNNNVLIQAVPNGGLAGLKRKRDGGDRGEGKIGKTECLSAEETTPTQYLNGEPNGSHSRRNEIGSNCIAKPSLGCEEECVSPNGSLDEDSVVIDSVNPALQGQGNDLGSTCVVRSSVKSSKKRKRKGKCRDRVDEGQSEDKQLSTSDSPLDDKTSVLSEEARVWQYICKRSVFVSRPVPAKSCDRVPAKTCDGEPAKSSDGERPCRFGVSAPQFRQGNPSVDNKVFTDKTSNVVITVNKKKVKVTLTRESKVVQEWIENQSGRCFGLDVEWQPNRRKGQKDNKVALLQISTETECLLVQMLFLDSIPSALVQFLKDPEKKIAGVGIVGDAKKLERDYGLSCGGEVELTTLAVERLKNNELKRVGLKALAKHVLGFTILKSKSITMSNWAKFHLDRRQVEYACLDAWISFAILGKLQKSSVLDQETPALNTQIPVLDQNTPVPEAA